NGNRRTRKHTRIDVHLLIFRQPFAHGLLPGRKHAYVEANIDGLRAGEPGKCIEEMDMLITFGLAHQFCGGAPLYPDLPIVSWDTNLSGGYGVHHEEFAGPAKQESFLFSDLLDQREALWPVKC